MEPGKLTSHCLRRRKQHENAERIVAITAYDYSFARLLDEFCDVILVGDSLGMVVQGKSNTLSVRLEDMIYHCLAVSRGIRHAHLVADMPFMSYQISAEAALANAGRLIAEGAAEAVKIEGGMAVAHTVEKLVAAGIPVMGHIGLTPQSIHSFGGYKVQGRTEQAKEIILQDALALEDSGAYAIVLEGIPQDLAKRITEVVKIPTIGIGAGPHTDGQVLVLYDLLGLNETFAPKFLKKFSNLSSIVRQAISEYRKEILSGEFPAPEHSF